MNQQQQNKISKITECPTEILLHIVEYITAQYRKVSSKRERAIIFKTIHNLQSSCKIFNHIFNDFWWTVFEREAGYIYETSGSDSLINQLLSIKCKLIEKKKLKRSVLMFLNYIQFGSYKNDSSKELEIVKLAMLGSTAVGKTSLVDRYLINTFKDWFESTIEDFHRKKLTIDDMKVLVEIIDISGSQFNEGYHWRDQYIRDLTCFLIVASVDERDSLSTMEDLVQRIHRVKETEQVPCLLVLNKIDKLSDVAYTNAYTPHTIDQVKEIAAKSSVPHLVMETSAKTGYNVNACFEELIRCQFRGDYSRLQFYEKFLDNPDDYIKENARNKCIVM